VVATVALAAACGGGGGGTAGGGNGKGAGTAEVERLLVATQKNASPDLRVGNATCPPRVEVAEGATFDCTVVVEGVEAPYRVTATGVDPVTRTAHFAVQPAKAILSTAKVVAFLASQLSGAPKGVKVDCPGPPVRVFEPGATFDCRATDGRTTQVATLRVDDVQGKVTLVAAG